MDKSKLRLLADAYARGRVSRETYRVDRSALLNGIVSGQVELDRGVETPETEPDTVKPSSPTPVAQPATGQRVVLVIGVAAAALVLAWLLWPRPAPPPVVTAGSAPEPPPPPAVRRQPAAQTLVEDFLAADDWGEASVRRFLAVWRLLPQATREAARVTPWFARLDRELRDELRSQRALAELESGDKAGAATAPLLEFGRALGLEQLPAARPPRPGGSARNTPIYPPLPPREADLPSDLPGPRWVDAVDPDHYTLVLYAGDELVQVERLLHRNRDIELKVIPDPDGEPRYRVVHGAYPDLEEALLARAGLPSNLRVKASRPVSIGALREGAALPSPATRAFLPAAAAATDVQPSGPYTLQLFALADAQNVDRLLARYPALGLKVLDMGPPAPRYRVYFGEFPSRTDAEAAFYRLPADLVEEASQPVVRQRPSFSLAGHSSR